MSGKWQFYLNRPTLIGEGGGEGVKIVNRPNTFVQDCRWTLFDGQCTLTDTTGHTLPPTLPSLKDTPVRTRTLVNELL